jgi:putative membrane protein
LAPGPKSGGRGIPEALQRVIFGVAIPVAVAPARRRSEIVQPHNEHQSGPEQGSTDVREHLANERTLLSWVRTGVSLISLGLVVERAGALAKAAHLEVGSTSGSEPFGLSLALLGALTLILGTMQFLRNRRSIAAGDFEPSVVVYLIIVVGSLTFAGAFVIYVLLT